MQRTIFYSWQVDLPSDTNHDFIQAALEEASGSIASELAITAIIERDTRGVSGSPNIAKTVFDKIRGSDVFVADITAVGKTSAEKAVPNPNVMLELGYALDALGENRVILVMNTAYGRVEELPFDLKMRHTIRYTVASDDADKASERQRLASILKEAIVAAFKSVDENATAHEARFEGPALNLLHKHATFYKRVLRLIDEISQLRDHYLLNAPKPPEYEEKREALHTRFKDDYDVFEREVTQAEDRLRRSDEKANEEILTAIRGVRRSVETLVHWSNERLLAIDLRTLSWDRKNNAEEAARRLTALTLDRLRDTAE